MPIHIHLQYTLNLHTMSTLAYDQLVYGRSNYIDLIEGNKEIQMYMYPAITHFIVKDQLLVSKTILL